MVLLYLVCESWAWESVRVEGYKCPPDKNHVIVIRKYLSLLLMGYFRDARKRDFEIIQDILEPLKTYIRTLMQACSTAVRREKQQNLWIQSCRSLDRCRRDWMVIPWGLGRSLRGIPGNQSLIIAVAGGGSSTGTMDGGQRGDRGASLT